MAGEIVTLRMEGLADLQEKLTQLPPRAAKRALRVGLLAAAEIWRREMETRVIHGWHHFRGKAGSAQAPVFGYLSQNISVQARITNDLAGEIFVGPMKKGFWARFLEFGTRKMAARPFIVPSFEARKNDVLEEFAIETRAALEAEGLKLNR
jgi:HK97 gp10 family phage protein